LTVRPNSAKIFGIVEGGGEERVIENGAVFEKGGVNILLFMEIAADSMQKLFNVGEFFLLRTEFGFAP
jgi:coproporphyrinogen III oxidase